MLSSLSHTSTGNTGDSLAAEFQKKVALQCGNSDDVDSSSSDNNQEPPPVDDESDISIRLFPLDLGPS